MSEEPIIASGPTVRHETRRKGRAPNQRVVERLDLCLELQRTAAEISHHMAIEGAVRELDVRDRKNDIMVLYEAVSVLHRVAATLHVPAFEYVPEDPAEASVYERKNRGMLEV
jgi:glycerate-2-kinase